MFHLRIVLRILSLSRLDSSYPGGRFKDEVTEYYYGGDDPHRQQKQYAPRAPFQNQTYAGSERVGGPVRRQKPGQRRMCRVRIHRLICSCSPR